MNFLLKGIHVRLCSHLRIAFIFIRRVIPLGWGFICGYAAPRYEKAVNGTDGNTGTGKKSVEAVAKEVLAGKWGNGENRKKKLQAAGYDYGAVQRKA